MFKLSLSTTKLSKFSSTFVWELATFETLWSLSHARDICTGCPKKHGNSVTNSISSLLWISIVIPNFKSHKIIMSARVYFMKTVNGCKDVNIMSPQDEQWRRTSSLFCILQFSCFTTVCSQMRNKQNVKIAEEITVYSFLSRYHHTKSKYY